MGPQAGSLTSLRHAFLVGGTRPAIPVKDSGHGPFLTETLLPLDFSGPEVLKNWFPEKPRFKTAQESFCPFVWGESDFSLSFLIRPLLPPQDPLGPEDPGWKPLLL